MIEEKNEEITVHDRRKQILEIINNEGKVVVTKLSKLFEISEVTIRNDLAELEKSGLIERTHGGAVSTYKNYYSMAFNERMNINTEEKKRISAMAASKIQDGDTVMISSGTTPLYMIRELKDRKSLTVVTNSISVAQEFSCNSNIYVIMLGGNLNSRYLFNYGDDTLKQLMKYKADKLILSPDGVSFEDGISTCYHLESEVNKQMIERSKETIVVADYTKIGRTSFTHIGAINEIDCLITNTIANKDEIQAIKDMGVEVDLV